MLPRIALAVAYCSLFAAPVRAADRLIRFDLPGRGVGMHGRPQAEPGQQDQDERKSKGGQLATTPAQPPR